MTKTTTTAQQRNATRKATKDSSVKRVSLTDELDLVESELEDKGIAPESWQPPTEGTHRTRPELRAAIAAGRASLARIAAPTPRGTINPPGSLAAQIELRFLELNRAEQRLEDEEADEAERIAKGLPPLKSAEPETDGTGNEYWDTYHDMDPGPEREAYWKSHRAAICRGPA